MYQIEGARILLGGRRKGAARVLSLPRVARTVVLLGLDQPAHRHLLGDGRGRPAAVPGRGTLGFSPLAVRRHRRHLPGRGRARPAGQRLRRRPLERHKEVAGGRLRPLGGLQARPAGGRQRVRARSARSSLVDRIGKGIRTAPRDAMISLSSAPRRARHRVRRAPRDGHRRRDARPARSPSACWRMAPLALRLDLPRQLLLRA